MTYLAQNPIPLSNTPIQGIGPLGLQNKLTAEVFTVFPNVISLIIGFLTAAAFLWFLLQLFLGAISWISSGGDVKSVEQARSRIMNAVIGLVLVLAALIFFSVIGTVIGIDILNLNAILIKLTP